MTRKIKDLVSGGTLGEARESASAEGLGAGHHNTPAPAPAHPKIIGIRRGPGGWAEWLVSINGVCTDIPVRDRRLRRYRRFRNVILYRFGIYFDPMPQADWSAMVDAAIALHRPS